MAKKIKKVVGYSSGREATLSGLAGLYLFLGSAALVACVLVSGFWTKQSPYDGWGENGVSWFWIVAGVIGFFQGLVAYIVLNGIADTLRVAKKIAGLPYYGTISGCESGTTVEVCSECGREIGDYRPIDWDEIRAGEAGRQKDRCPHCKAEFDAEEAS